MSKTIVISLIFYLIFAGKVFAEEPSAVFAKANTEYQQGRYEEAGGLYEQILESGQESGALYYNLGNSYFKKGQIGKAILNYERALDFFPRDADLQANYAFARSITRGL
ncbi:MAG TPA: tetratricopeptide repeat protein, partial [Candidatus Omnitrophota bacterium]|nr:tetratricopeptide repeat protein [Candidatus Omnitrophota bacterium]